MPVRLEASDQGVLMSERTEFLVQLREFGQKNGWEPIKDDRGELDHRGRKWPVCQSPCVPCITAWVCL